MSNKGKRIRLICACYQAPTGPIISLKDKELNPSGGYENILHLYLETLLVPPRLFFRIKMPDEDGKAPVSFAEKHETGIFQLAAVALDSPAAIMRGRML